MPKIRIATKGFGTWGGRQSGGSGNSNGRSKHSPDQRHTPMMGVHGSGTTHSYSSGPSSESEHERQRSCYMDLQGFVDCINTNASDISVCQENFDAFMACKDAHEKQRRKREEPGIWGYILP